MTETNADQSHHPGQRIAKAMARAGLCSRREAEAWILAGRVSVNGEILASPALNVVEGDDIRVDGEPLKAHERTRLFLFHKPRGLVTTARDPEGRPTIFGALPKDLPRVVAVGRLDINTEGLLLLTNDGGLARVLELPATGWLRRYRVRAHGSIDQAALDGLREGVSIEGVHYAGIDARLERTQGSNVWLTMGLREGKNREIKRVLESLGLSVNRLIRISFGPFELADLAEGEVVEARTRVLRDQLGPRLAREAGVDFDAPLVERAEPEPEPAPAAESRRAPATLRRPPPSTLPRPGRAEPQSRDAPRREPPRSAGPERKRKHVDALRAESAAAAAGPRKRIERSATSDRHGRVVAVERVLPTREEERRRELARQKAEARREGRGPRAGKPFEPRHRAEGGERPLRRSGGRFGEQRSAESRGGDATPREDRAPRAAKPYEPRHRAESGQRPPRRPEARFSEGRNAERGGGDATPREERAPRAGKPFQPRDRAEGGARPPRRSGERFAAAPGAERRGGEPAPREDRRPRKPRLNKPFAKRPAGGKGRSGPRDGRPAGKRPPRRP
jgi:23S rRNA pseudouridine2605 synthase